jgi:hypothetical protein
MAAAHYVGVEPLLDHCSGAGFHDRFALYSRGPLGTFVEFGSNPLGIFGR